MEEEIIFEELSKKEALLLLRAFNFDVDNEGYVLNNEGMRMPSEEVPKEYIKLKNAALTPGSLNVIESSPTSLSKFIREWATKNK